MRQPPARRESLAGGLTFTKSSLIPRNPAKIQAPSFAPAPALAPGIPIRQRATSRWLVAIYLRKDRSYHLYNRRISYAIIIICFIEYYKLDLPISYHNISCIIRKLGGKWKFYAEDDIDAMRVALYYCYLDGKDFIKIESGISTSKHKTLRICLIDDKNSIRTLR